MVDINTFKITKVLRQIPGKRRVVEASSRGKNYIVKFFKKKNLYEKEIKVRFISIKQKYPPQKFYHLEN